LADNLLFILYLNNIPERVLYGTITFRNTYEHIFFISQSL